MTYISKPLTSANNLLSWDDIANGSVHLLDALNGGVTATVLGVFSSLDGLSVDINISEDPVSSTTSDQIDAVLLNYMPPGGASGASGAAGESGDPASASMFERADVDVVNPTTSILPKGRPVEWYVDPNGLIAVQPTQNTASASWVPAEDIPAGSLSTPASGTVLRRGVITDVSINFDDRAGGAGVTPAVNGAIIYFDPDAVPGTNSQIRRTPNAGRTEVRLGRITDSRYRLALNSVSPLGVGLREGLTTFTADQNTTIQYAHNGASTYTMPGLHQVSEGTQYAFVMTGGGTLTLSPFSSDTINGSNSALVLDSTNAPTGVLLTKDGTNWSGSPINSDLTYFTYEFDELAFVKYGVGTRITNLEHEISEESIEAASFNLFFAGRHYSLTPSDGNMVMTIAASDAWANVGSFRSGTAEVDNLSGSEMVRVVRPDTTWFWMGPGEHRSFHCVNSPTNGRVVIGGRIAYDGLATSPQITGTASASSWQIFGLPEDILNVNPSDTTQLLVGGATIAGGASVNQPYSVVIEWDAIASYTGSDAAGDQHADVNVDVLIGGTTTSSSPVTVRRRQGFKASLVGRMGISVVAGQTISFSATGLIASHLVIENLQVRIQVTDKPA